MDQQTQDALTMSAAGMNAADIAKELRIPVRKVYHILTPHSALLRRQRRAAVLEAYQRGDTIATIRSEYGVSATTISLWRDQAGIQPRNGRASEAQIIEAYKRGDPIASITTTLCSRDRLYSVLRRNGIKLRAPKGKTPFD